MNREGTSRIPIGLAGANPSYRRGLEAGLEDHGWQLVQVAHAEAWAAEQDRCVLLVYLDRRREVEEIQQLPKRDDFTVIVLVPDPIAEDVVTLVRAGATTVLDAYAEPDTIAAALEEVATGAAILPLLTFHRLVAMARSHTDRPAIADEEVSWLRELSRGVTIGELASHTYRSERSMHRALAGLYERIGVRNRDQAVAWASRHAVLDDL